MPSFVVYKIATGEIQSIGTSSLIEEIALQTGGDPELAVIVAECKDDLTYYIVEGKVTPRPFMPTCKIPKDGWLADGGSKLVWKNAPIGTEVFIDAKSVGINDTPLIEITATVAAEYKIRLVPPFPYMIEEWSIIANVV